MTFAFPAFHEATVAKAHTAESIEAAMRRVGWNSIQQTTEGVSCAVPLTIWSFGERVLVTREEGRIVLRSSCVLPTQCMDWGKNRRNIQSLVAALEG